MMKTKLLVSQLNSQSRMWYRGVEDGGVVVVVAWWLKERRRKMSRSSFETDRQKTRTLLGNGYSLPRHEEKERGEKSSNVSKERETRGDGTADVEWDREDRRDCS